MDRVESGLFSRRWGGGSLEAVFLHGALLSSRAWDAVLERMTIGALAVDLPGHGESAWYSDGDYDLDRVSDDIAGLVRSNASRPVSLVGHSRGGSVAARVAARLPALVDRLILVDANPIVVAPVSAPTPQRHTGTLDQLVDDIHRLRPDLSRARVEDGVRRGALERGANVWAWRWDPRTSRRSSAGEVERGRPQLAMISADVTIIRGAKSETVTEEGIRLLEDALGRSVRCVTVPSGHNPQAEIPDRLATLLDSMLIRPIAV